MRIFLRRPLPQGRWLLRGGLIFAGFCVVALAFYLANDYHQERARAESLWQYRLSQFTAGRAELVARWAAARESDATDVAGYPAVFDVLSAVKSEASRKLLERRLSLLARGYGYHAICIEGEPSSGLLCSDGASGLEAELGPSRLGQLRPGASAMYPLRSPGGEQYLCVAARNREPGPPGGAYLIVDPSQWLHPALREDRSFGPPVTFLLVSAGGAGLIARSPGADPLPPDWPNSGFVPVRASLRSERIGALEVWLGEYLAVRHPIRGTDWVCVGLVAKSLAVHDMQRQFFTRAAAAGVFCLALITLVFGLGREMEVRNLRALSRQEERHRLLSDNAADMVLYVREDGAVFDANRAAEAACGLAKHELVGRPLSEVFVPEEAQDSAVLLRKAFADGWLAEGTWKRADGGAHQVEASCRGVEFDGQRFALLIARDVSGRKKAEAALLAARQELEQAKQLEAVGLVASGVAHEVRNPLFAISTIVTALERKLADRPEFGQYVGHIQDQVGRLSTLMNDLLALGRPEDSGSYRPTDLAQTVRDSLRHLAQSAPQAEERCGLRLPELPVLVWGSAEKLEQVVLNLVQNALSFSPPGEPVEIRLVAEDGQAVLEVLDRGPGIPEEIHRHLFEPFRSRRKGGTGLGLAIVLKIVSAHGGTVQGENRTPAAGARFAVALPLWHERPQ